MTMSTTMKPDIYQLRYEDPEKVESCIAKYGPDGFDPDLVIVQIDAGNHEVKARGKARKLAKQIGTWVEVVEYDIEPEYIAADDVTLWSISDSRVVFDADGLGGGNVWR